MNWQRLLKVSFGEEANSEDGGAQEDVRWASVGMVHF